MLGTVTVIRLICYKDSRDMGSHTLKKVNRLFSIVPPVTAGCRGSPGRGVGSPCHSGPPLDMAELPSHAQEALFQNGDLPQCPEVDTFPGKLCARKNAQYLGKSK